MIVAIERAAAVGASERLHPAALVLVNLLLQAKEAPAVLRRKEHNSRVAVLDKQRLPLRIVWARSVRVPARNTSPNLTKFLEIPLGKRDRPQAQTH